MQNLGIRSVFKRSYGWRYVSVTVCFVNMFTTSLMIKCFKQNFNALFYRYFLFASSETNRIPTNTKSSEISELIHGFIYKASLEIFYYCIQLKEWQSIICVAFDLDLLSNKTALKINTICKLFTVNACTNMHVHKIIGQLLAICSHYSEFKSLVILVVKIN